MEAASAYQKMNTFDLHAICEPTLHLNGFHGLSGSCGHNEGRGLTQITFP